MTGLSRNRVPALSAPMVPVLGRLRCILQGFCCFSLIALGIILQNADAENVRSLYVFYPSTTRPPVFAQKLTESCPGLNVTVFGRYQDFSQRTESDEPDIIITKPPVLKTLPPYVEKMRGIRKGSTEEPCVLLSIDVPVNQDSLSNIRLGVVDFLGRTGTEGFVADLLGAPMNLNRVTKIEDLLPMLTFNKAQAVFVGESIVPYFKKITLLNLVITRLPGCATGIAICATREQTDPGSIKNDLLTIEKNTSVLLEIDQWKPIY
jgi:hypothetical protein